MELNKDTIYKSSDKSESSKYSIQLKIYILALD